MTRDCTTDPTGLPPITDLGAGLYQGLQGGLYAGGLNTRPSAHTDDGLAQGADIVPRDTAGTPSTTGKVVFSSIGMSNCRYSFKEFMAAAMTNLDLHPNLFIWNGATGAANGAVIEDMDDHEGQYWTDYQARLEQGGCSAGQVQAAYVRLAYGAYPSTEFDQFRLQSAIDMGRVMRTAKTVCPNLVLAYCSTRVYGGYTDVPNRDEPGAYWYGWGMKALIEAQIDGDPGLTYDVCPWLSWADYPWADDGEQRIDGLTWDCPADFQDDGYHLTPGGGAAKAADMIMGWAVADPTVERWLFSDTGG